ncbi:RHS repeat-associated core domain-containing protein [Streptomyces massasporeus]
MPPVKVGANRPVASERAENPTDEALLPWQREQRERVKGPAGKGGGEQTPSRTAAANASALSVVPEGQGNVPWHRSTSFAITDALTAKIDYSTGNLMLTATDFDIAGAGQRLQLARTYNSLDAPWGRLSQRWWQQYERYLSVDSSEVIFYDASGATVRFTKNSEGFLTTPKGYSQDLKKNADGTYTLTKRKSGTKEAYNQYGTLTKITDRNKGTITVTQHDEDGEKKGKLTETRSGRFIDLVKTNPSQWQAKDNTGLTAVYNLDADGNLATTTDTEGKTVTFRHDSSGRIDKITTAEGRVTVFTYDDTNRVTSMLRGTAFNSDGHAGPTWTYSAASPQGTLVDLAYTYGYGTNAGTDGSEIRTLTDNVRNTKRTYSYDGAGRFSYAKEEKSGAVTDSWQYCYDLAGNLTSQGTDQGCPRGTTYTYNDAQQLTAKSTTSSPWTYDAIGNETADASTDDYARTGEKWTDHSQMSSITVGGKAYAGQYGSTDQSERIKLGDTYFHNGPLGLSAKTTAGVDMGCNREPGGTLNSMTTGGKTYYYVTDAIGSVVALADGDGNKVNTYAYSPRGVRILAQSSEPVAQPYRFAGGYQDPTGLYHFQARYYDANIGRFTQPDPSGQEENPYLYAEGDPVNRIDPQGLWSWQAGAVRSASGSAWAVDTPRTTPATAAPS